MPVIIYPPSLPLYDTEIHHRTDMERFWANPVPFLPFLLFTTLLFLLGLWGVPHATAWPLFSGLAPVHARLLASLIPPLVLVCVLFILPQLTSPVWGYFNAMSLDPLGRQLRWNLAVVATAHIYCGNLAQTEWLSQMTLLTVEDRVLAFGYIKRVRSRLQQIPVLRATDLLYAILASLSVVVLSWGFLHVTPFEALFYSLALLIVVQIFMLYLYTQRWQHIRRLMELEEIFDELLPANATAPKPTEEDEVTRWAHAQEEEEKARTSRPSALECPPAPWE